MNQKPDHQTPREKVESRLAEYRQRQSPLWEKRDAGNANSEDIEELWKLRCEILRLEHFLDGVYNV